MSGLRGLIGKANKSSSVSCELRLGTAPARVTSPFNAASSDMGAAVGLGAERAEKEDTAMSAPPGERVWDWLPALVKVLA